jgi:restriction endonuclease Mrr
LVRRDGKDIGRERVTELRGALHHYGPAAIGWIISTGQVLSGAREEAQSQGGSPVTLIGRNELSDLCVAYGVGVRTHRVEIPIIDVELLENLQGR